MILLYSDGVPLYGYCKNSGTQFTSCYKLASGATAETITTAAGDFESASIITDYEYDQVLPLIYIQ